MGGCCLLLRGFVRNLSDKVNPVLWASLIGSSERWRQVVEVWDVFCCSYIQNLKNCPPFLAAAKLGTCHTRCKSYHVTRGKTLQLIHVSDVRQLLKRGT